MGLIIHRDRGITPANKTIMMLDNPSSVQQKVLGALQQLQQVGSGRRIARGHNDLAAVLFNECSGHE